MAALNAVYRFCHLELELSGYNKDVVVLLIIPRVTLDAARLCSGSNLFQLFFSKFLELHSEAKVGVSNVTAKSDHTQRFLHTQR